VIAEVMVHAGAAEPEADPVELLKSACCYSKACFQSRTSAPHRLSLEGRVAIKGTFKLVEHRHQWELLSAFHTACCKQKAANGKVPDAISTLAFTAGELQSIHGVSNGAVALCKKVALRYVAFHFTSLSATPAFSQLPAPLMGQLLRMDELGTDTEEHTLIAIEPWLREPGRSAADVVEALEGLRWAWLPLEAVLQLRRMNGLLYQFGCDDGVRRMIDAAVALICWSRKRKHEDEADQLTCPITFDLFEDPVVAADGNTYERSAIEAMFAFGNNRSPLTNEPLASTQLTPCRQLKKLCDAQRMAGAYIGTRKRIFFGSLELPDESVSKVLDEWPGPRVSAS